MLYNVSGKHMRDWKLWRYSRPLLVAGLLVIGTAGPVLANTSRSDNFQVSETQFGGGSSLNSCSGSYCTRASIGSMSGNTSENTSIIEFSPLQGTDPRLEVIVQEGESNLGELSTSRTATKTMIVKISNYLTDGGYIVQMIGDPPKFRDHSLATPTTPTASTPGTEQFAINLALNTTPAVGAAPVQVPDEGTVFGAVEDDYATPNLFKYVSEDVVASSVEESGRTDYTVSMIVNVSNTTPAGHYSGDYAIVVIPAY